MPKPLAEIVIEQKLASRAAVREAADIADKEKIPLVAALVRTAQLNEVALVAALRKHLRVPTCDPAETVADPEAIREVSRDVCRRLRVIPLAISSYGTGRRRLQIAMADPTDAVALAEMEHITGCQIEPQLMTLSAVEELVETTYRQFVTEVMKRNSQTIPTPAPSGKSTPGDDGPTTMPHHRISDEATTDQKIQALTRLLIAKGLVSEDELEEELRTLIKSTAG